MMMKHAILIMAHKNVEHLCRLIGYFNRQCEVFVHVDKKVTLNREEMEMLNGLAPVKFLSRKYEVNWGGTSVLECEMYLMQKALELSDANYFHLLSGQDYPVRPLCEFLDFFEQNDGKEYLQYSPLPHPHWEEGTFRRLQYYYPYDLASDKEKPREWVREQVKQQVIRGIKRPIPDEFDHLYGGSQWFSITRKAVDALLDYTRNHPSLYKRMWMTFAPEECYVATVLRNLMEKDCIQSTNLRFIRWQYENGNRPSNLGKEHFHHLLEKDYFFARKMESPYCEELLPLIERYLWRDKEAEQSSNGGWIYDGVLKYQYEEAFGVFVTRFCQDVSIIKALDMGCGAGYYVSQWRRRGLQFAGYDANPYTPALSQLLLPDGDTPCGVADLTDTLEIAEPFDLVVCKDVLPYIPQEMEYVAIRNLAALSSHFILLSWQVPELMRNIHYRELREKDVLLHFEEEGFVEERYITAMLRMALNRQDCCMLIKKGMQIINK